MAAPSPTKPVFEHHHDGLGIGYSRPRISWKFTTSPDTVSGWIQTSYELEITSKRTGTSEIFPNTSQASSLVLWPAEPLQSRDRATVRVRCRGVASDNDCIAESVTPWSPWAEVEAGFLHRDDWTSSFITSSMRLGSEGPLQPLRFRKPFSLPAGFKRVSHARLYMTGLGVHKAYLNGSRVSDEEMAPGWTSYNHRLNYRVLDVTGLVNADRDNILAVEVAEGWYAGVLGMRKGTRFVYGGRDLAVILQLEVYADSRPEPFVVASDDSWVCTQSPILSSEIYNGETVDFRHETSGGWSNAIDNNNNNVVTWHTTRIIDWPDTQLVAPDAPPVRVVQTVEPINTITTTSGKTVLDFGQNIVGKVMVRRIDLSRDAQLTLRHAEVMEHGELGTRPLREAKATDVLVSAGEPIENWTPQFTIHGFRYVQVDGLVDSEAHGALHKSNFVGLVMHTDLERTGDFTCSNAMVNQLYSNIVWSMKGNFVSIPTDCPQRNERLGWTGDLQVFCPTASFLYNTTGMLKDWLQDLAAEQFEEGNGGIPALICPQVPLPVFPHMPSAVWDDVTVLTPWTLYQYTRDEELLHRQYESMRCWLEQGVRRGLDSLWDQDFWQLADWLDPTAPPNDPANGLTDDVLVADEYLVHTTTVFADICRILGKTEKHNEYRLSADRLRACFQDKYVSPSGFLMSNTQTAIALAIEFSLYRNAQQVAVAARQLTKLVRKAEFRIRTGFAGTPAILHALTAVQQPQLAYRMLLEKRCPSWLYPVTMGATTIWERWDSMLPDGSINPGLMTSFNHYALGAVASWLHATVGGLSPAEPGWKVIRVRPIPGGNLTHATVSFRGPYGEISCAWKFQAGVFSITLVVPPNSSARVTLPSNAESERTVQSGTHHFSCAYSPPDWPPEALIAPHRSKPEESIA